MALLIHRALSGIGRLSRWLLASVLLCLAASRCPAGDPAPPSNEYQVKAVFLYNFAQFAEWPTKSFADAQSPFIIAILGRDPFGSYLDEVVRDEKVGSRPFVIRRCKKIEDARGCHILFISRSESSHLGSILKKIRRDSTLTISDADGFNRLGGMVRFVMESGKVRLRINLEAAKETGITISSKILRPSTIVPPGKD